MRSIFTIVLIAIFASFAIRSHFAAMLMYWWFAIFRPQEFMHLDIISSLRIPLLAAILFIAPTILRGYFPRVNSFQATLVLLWLGNAVIADVIAGCNNANAPLNLSYLGILFLCLSLTERLLTSEKRILGLLFTVSMSLTILMAKSGLHSAITQDSLYNANIGSGSFSGTNPAALGTVQAIFILIFVIQVISGKNGKEFLPAFLHPKLFRRTLVWFVWFILIFSVYFVIATQSRGSALALIGAMIFWILLHPRKIRIMVSIAVLSSSFLMIYSLPQEYSERLASAFVQTEDLDSSAASRPHFWRVAKGMADDNFMGVGVGCYGKLYNDYDFSEGYYGRFRSVHSSHYGVLAELGYTGITLWILLLLSTYWKFWKIRRYSKPHLATSSNSRFYFYLANAMICAQTAFIVGGSFYEMTYDLYTWLTFCIVITAGQLYRAAENQTVEEDSNQSSAYQLRND